jgi:uncharacterized membrane protein YsdA (DUF1294 family)
MSLLGLLAAWLMTINVVTFIAYARDKRAARRGTWRTRERTLYVLNLAGGFIGGWLGMRLLRHKTLHTSFKVVQSIATVIWIGLLALVILGPGSV